MQSQKQCYSIMKNRFLFVWICFTFGWAFSAWSGTTDSLLRVYDSEIAHAQQYFDLRQARIDSLLRQPRSAHRLLQLAELYRPYQSDSATVQLQRVIEHYPQYATVAQVKLLFLYASIGSFVDAVEVADEIHNVPDSLRMPYFEAMHRLYSWMSNNTKSSSKAALLAEKGLLYLDSMNQEALRQPHEPVSINAQIMRYNEMGNYKAALQANDSILAIISPSSHEFALYAYQRHLILQDLSQPELSIQWLIRSAITDVRCGVADNGASWVLAKQLYQRGEQQRANRYRVLSF